MCSLIVELNVYFMIQVQMVNVIDVSWSCDAVVHQGHMSKLSSMLSHNLNTTYYTHPHSAPKPSKVLS